MLVNQFLRAATKSRTLRESLRSFHELNRQGAR
jgi:hypothetical protein